MYRIGPHVLKLVFDVFKRIPKKIGRTRTLLAKKCATQNDNNVLY